MFGRSKKNDKSELLISALVTKEVSFEIKSELRHLRQELRNMRDDLRLHQTYLHALFSRLMLEEGEQFEGFSKKWINADVAGIYPDDLKNEEQIEELFEEANVQFEKNIGLLEGMLLKIYMRKKFETDFEEGEDDQENEGDQLEGVSQKMSK